MHYFPFVASTLCPCVFRTKHFTCLIVTSLRSNPLTLQVWGQTLAVLIKIITRWGQRTRRAKSTESNGQEAAGDGWRYGYRMWHFKSKHVVVKKDKRTRARGRKQITCERSKSDRKQRWKELGRGAGEGQSWRHVKAEITGYPCVISLGVYLRLPQRYRLLSPGLTK